MVNISKALNATQVHQYHRREYSSATEKSYYNQNGEVVGKWHGKLAEEMGLNGPVSSEHFHRVAEGQDPFTGEQLVKHRFATDHSAQHRAGWDATFSAPKSVSITALVGGDERVLEAHREATRKGLDYLERFAHARIGGNHAPEPTGKWIAATFEHDTSRPVNGYSAPQLHTHAVFFNIQKTQDGKTHALQARQIFEAQKTATAIYQAELGYRLRQLGYELEEGKGGAREIKGYTPDYLKANSSRSEQIDQLAKELEAKGIKRAEARQKAAHSTRQAKTHFTAEQTRAQQMALAAQYGNQHEGIIAAARRKEIQEALSPQQAANQAVTFSRERNFEREAVVTHSDLLREALRRGDDLTTTAHIEFALSRRQEKGELIPVKTNRGLSGYTTPEMVALEKSNIAVMKAGQHAHSPIIHEADIRQESVAPLNAAQKAAALQILTSRDRVQALQGAAGTGKTFTLTVIRRELENNGYAVKGLAPTSRATQQLAECGAECSTLQMHLTKPAGPDQQKPTVYFLDETSLASTRQVNQLLTGLKPGDRVVLIGDVRQHESVEAGRAFAQLQDYGVETARLDQIIRQKDPHLKEVVERLAAGKVAAAVSLLRDQNRVTEITDEHKRLTAIAGEYLKSPGDTLVVSPDNRSRAAINEIVHDQLKRSGDLASGEHSIRVLVNRQDLTGADRKWAKAYEPGNVIRYNTGSQKLGIERGDYAAVTNRDTGQNLLTVQKGNQAITYNAERLHGVSVYRPEDRTFAVGERVQFTTPFKDQKIANRELGKITRIDGSRLTVSLDSGRTTTFDTKKFAHLDYGYAVTSHSSQGLTTGRVLINIDSDRTNRQLINDRLAYVAVSRARDDAHIYTNDAGKLAQILGRDVSKTSALQPSQQNTHVQEPAPPDQLIHRQAEMVQTPAKSQTPAETISPQQSGPDHKQSVSPGRKRAVQHEIIEEQGLSL
jgi:conjugative relaxase-like TrwC/TraI family protein